MDKGRQPTLWSNHNLNSLADEAFRRTEEKRRARAIGEILDQPDGYEDNKIDAIGRKDPLSDLDRMLGLAFDIGISPKFLSNYIISAKLFNPHESVVDSSNAIPIEVHTSVVAFDIYEKATSTRETGAKVGSILLPKLSANLIDEPAPDMTAKDLIWRKNCTYAALVHDDTITYFEFALVGGDRVRSEVRRKDPTEDSGQSVEMQFVKKGEEYLSIRELSSSSKEAIELDQEMEKFIASRREVVAPDEE